MHHPLRNVLVLSLLAAMAAATWYWSRPQAPAPIARGPGEDTPPGYYMRDAVVLQTDEEGRVMYRVHADFAREQPGEATLLLDGVHIEYREEEAVPWDIRAEHAAARAQLRTLELEGGVELVRHSSAPGERVVVRTERLLLEPERYFASAPGDVTFTVGPSTLAATGLKAFLKEDRVELESNGHGRFQP